MRKELVTNQNLIIDNWGLGPVPYKTLAEEEIEVEPVVTVNVKRRKTFRSCSEDAVWTVNFDYHKLLGSESVISASVS
ncbi:hypothetical protein TNCT_550721 [Trichonephila clavata]|uniref:Uncharacterized protein n=1 Tax=Trichonephila clavata TaxID=2740835 RepID=A0A8X6HUH0_TRICU|nr:hypothetical protein TNCT_550721 [Trichonephila clavata]